MSNPKRLHPIAIIFNMMKPIKELLFSFIIILVMDGFSTYFFLFLFIFLLVDLVYGFLAWRKFSYYVTDEALHLEYGIIRHTKRTISKNRIQSIDLTENIVHRMFRLVKVQIETAGGGHEAEASLAAITLREGENLREILKNAPNGKETLLEEQTVVTKKILMSRLVIAGFTSGGIGIVFGFLIAVLLELEEIVPENVYDRVFAWISASSIITILLLVLISVIIVWLFGVLWVIIRYGDFTIKRTENELLITRGLLERKQITIPLHRIQAIGVEENIFRQPFGYATVFAEVAGYRAKGELLDSTVLFPLLHKREIAEFVQNFLGEYAYDEAELNWVKPKKAALPFYLIRSSACFLIAGVVVYLFIPSFLWIPIVLFALSIALGWFNYKDAGYYLTEERIFIQYRFIKRVSIQLYHKRIQAFEKKQHAFQKKLGMATMQVSIIHNLGGKHLKAKDFEEEMIDVVNDSLAYRKAGPS